MAAENGKLKGVAGVLAALFVLLVLPLLVQRYTGYSAVVVAFPVILFLAAVNWYLKKR